MIDPNKSFVNLTYKCNSNCISCIMEYHYQDVEISFLEIKEKINNILRVSNHIEFNGGEPTLRKDVFKILDYTNKVKSNVEVGLISNARIFSNKANVDRLKELSMSNFKVVTSIYGHDAKLHDAITRTPGSFEQQIDGIKNLISEEFNVELRIIINKINSSHLDKMADFISNNFENGNFIQVVFVNMKIYGIALDNKDLVTYRVKDIVENLKSAVEILDSKGFKVALYHFPFCVIPKELWKFVKGVTAEESEISFVDDCEFCIKRSECSGIWNGYLDKFGGNEFKMIHKLTDNYFLKLYYDNSLFLKSRYFYELFKKNGIPVLDTSYIANKFNEADAYSLTKSSNMVHLDVLFARERSDTIKLIVKKLIDLLNKIHNIKLRDIDLNYIKSYDYYQMMKNYFEFRLITNDIYESLKKLSFNEVVSHNDFNLTNFLVERRSFQFSDLISLIDFDDSCIYDIHYDAALLIFYSQSMDFGKLFFDEYIKYNLLENEDKMKILFHQLKFVSNIGIPCNKEIREYIIFKFKKLEPLFLEELSILKSQNEN